MSPDEAKELEHLKAQLAWELETVRNAAAHQLETIKADALAQQARIMAAASYAGGAIRSLLLVNGGAAVGILTVLGSLQRNGLSSGIRLEERGIKSSVIAFCFGLVCSLVSAGLASIAQIKFIERTTEDYVTAGVSIRILSGLALVCSLISFIVGAIFAVDALSIPTGTPLPG